MYRLYSVSFPIKVLQESILVLLEACVEFFLLALVQMETVLLQSIHLKP